MALSPLPWVPEVSKWPAEDAHLLLHCLTQLAQSLLASHLSPLHWYTAWNGAIDPLPLSPTKVLLECLGPFQIPLLSWSS